MPKRGIFNAAAAAILAFAGPAAAQPLDLTYHPLKSGVEPLNLRQTFTAANSTRDPDANLSTGPGILPYVSPLSSRTIPEAPMTYRPLMESRGPRFIKALDTNISRDSQGRFRLGIRARLTW